MCDKSFVLYVIMEHAALNMSEFNEDIRVQMKGETSRAVRIVLITYRCLGAIGVIVLTQIIILVVNKIMQDREISNAVESIMKIKSNTNYLQKQFYLHVVAAQNYRHANYYTC